MGTVTSVPFRIGLNAERDTGDCPSLLSLQLFLLEIYHRG